MSSPEAVLGSSSPDRDTQGVYPLTLIFRVKDICAAQQIRCVALNRAIRAVNVVWHMLFCPVKRLN